MTWNFVYKFLIPCFRINFQSYAFSWILTLTLKKRNNWGLQTGNFLVDSGTHSYHCWLMSHLTSATIDSEDNVRSTVHENFQEVLRGLTLFRQRGIIYTLCFCTRYRMRYCTRYLFLHPLLHALLHIAHVNTRVIARVIIHTLVRHPSRHTII